jgi:hypothetical protein
MRQGRKEFHEVMFVRSSTGERPTIDGQQFPRDGLLSHSFAQASGIR